MAKESLLYFSLSASVRAAYPASNFLGCDMSGANTLTASFLKEDGTADAAVVTLTTQAGKAKDACEALAAALAGKAKGLTIIADTENAVYMYPFTAITGIA